MEPKRCIRADDHKYTQQSTWTNVYYPDRFARPMEPKRVHLGAIAQTTLISSMGPTCVTPTDSQDQWNPKGALEPMTTSIHNSLRGRTFITPTDSQDQWNPKGCIWGR